MRRVTRHYVLGGIAVSLLLVSLSAAWTTGATMKTTRMMALSTTAANSRMASPLQASSSSSSEKDENDEEWDSDVNYEKEFSDYLAESKSPDPNLSWNAPRFDDIDDDGTPKLGIDVGKMLEPLSAKEAAELKAAATEIINDAVAEGIDEIESVRKRMKKEFENKRKSMQAASELKAQRESDKLMSKIDALTDAFLSKTELSRSSTKLAASADKANEGQGVEVGVWGNLGGAAVTTSAGQQTLLGSIKAAGTGAQQKPSVQEDSRPLTATENRIVVVADTQQDPYTKQLLPSLTDELKAALPGLEVDVYKPTATLPLGGNNAACVILFGTSLSGKSTVKSALDRLLRKTLQVGGAIGNPPTQLVLVSTVGTERFDKMPYSMQNLMGGGKLEKQRQMEETVIRTVRDRVTEPPLDFTICRLGELKGSVSDPFQLMPGDILDGSLGVDTAATVLKQAIAFQPAARNATLCCVGSLPDGQTQALLDDNFLRLDGPELIRLELSSDAEKNFDQLAEYLREWADLLSTSKKGLTTPIRAEIPPLPSSLPSGVVRQQGVQLVFLPTATGKNYMSRSEERAREKEGSKSRPPPLRKNAKEGGVEVLVEITDQGTLRVRAKRCNYADDAVIKELSEQTILSRLKDSINVWKNDHQL